MSGGHFNYNQHFISEIADEVEQLILNNGKRRETPKPWDEEYYSQYSPDVIKRMQEGLRILREAEVYAHRIDWLVSGDDDEDSFLTRLNEDLEKLKQ